MSTQAADPRASFWSTLLSHGVGKHRNYKYFFLIFATIIALELVGTYGIVKYVPCTYEMSLI